MKKNEKKKNWSAENGLGYCPTVSQYNGKLYCDIADCLGVQKGCWVCHNTKNCIVTQPLECALGWYCIATGWFG